MYRNIESLCCVKGINKCCRSNFKNKQNKLIEKEIRFVVTRGGGWGEGNWMKVVKRYKLPVIR